MATRRTKEALANDANYTVSGVSKALLFKLNSINAREIRSRAVNILGCQVVIEAKKML
ncbi:MAG: hypothetical protein IKX52_03935 [Clostridia bacterium]|nr:hypothetical protein [Clostridia bacterium]